MLILATPCGFLTGGTPLLVLLEVSKFGTLFVDLEATSETDLVLIGEKLGGGAYTFCFMCAGRNVEVLALALKLVQLKMDYWGDVLLHRIGSWIPRFQV